MQIPRRRPTFHLPTSIILHQQVPIYFCSLENTVKVGIKPLWSLSGWIQICHVSWCCTENKGQTDHLNQVDHCPRTGRNNNSGPDSSEPRWRSICDFQQQPSKPQNANTILHATPLSLGQSTFSQENEQVLGPNLLAWCSLKISSKLT